MKHQGGGNITHTIFFFSVYSAANFSFLLPLVRDPWQASEITSSRVFQRQLRTLPTRGGGGGCLAADGHTTDRTNEQNRQAAPPPKRKHSRFYFLNLTYKNNLKKLQKINLFFFLISFLKNTNEPQKLCSEPEMYRERGERSGLVK